MRRILLAATGTLAAVVAVFLYPTSTNQGVAAEVSTTADATTSAATSSATDSSTANSTTSGATDSSTTAPSTDSSSSSADTSTTSSAMADGTYSASSTMRYGTVTVTITVADGQITDASGVQDSSDNKSQMIASQAMPTLDSEAVSAQSSSIAMVSHATFTSSAYEQSLQAAIDQAFGA